MTHVGSILAAYSAVWIIFFGYYFTVARRVAHLSQEVERIKQTVGRDGRR